MDGDNSELILEAVLATHKQQLQTLRQRRLSLLRVARLNIILLSILIAIAGVTLQAQLPIGFSELLLPIGLEVAAIVLAVVKYKGFGEHWGFGLDREVTAEMNAIPRDSALEELVGIYQAASEENKNELKAIDRWIFRIIMIMCASFGSLLGLIVLST
ncbi:hypothetical protein [Halobellus inordinatus]|uniref:hypothetical protein n=1 Tax=Halobellus inordinatus TaxID=1126236 RepID=UPI00210CAC46|nr:hypothetical protein [Halobellus inordinatus]